MTPKQLMEKAMALSLAAGTKPEAIEAAADVAKGMMEEMMPKAAPRWAMLRRYIEGKMGDINNQGLELSGMAVCSEILVAMDTIEKETP